jgi:hypothetical protein
MRSVFAITWPIDGAQCLEVWRYYISSLWFYSPYILLTFATLAPFGNCEKWKKMTHPQCDQIKKTRPKSHRTHLLSYSVLYFLLKNDSILKQSAHSWDNIMITTFRQWALIFAKTSRIFVENILKKTEHCFLEPILRPTVTASGL